MRTLTIETSNISDWPSFHNEFKMKFGFPDYYGNNMDAWIDLMSYLNDEANDTSFKLKKGEQFILKLEGAKDFKNRCPELYDAIIESSAFVNFRNIESSNPPVIILAFE